MIQNFYSPNNARFDGTAKALTEDQLFKLAPSIFAVEAHASRSERFQPIPTIEVLRGLIKEGFSPVGARQSRSRDATRRDFTKHMIRMRRLDEHKTYSVGDSVFEIILKNANDGTAAYELMAGLFRIVCTNSLVSQSAELDSLKVRHMGSALDVQHKVIDGTYSVLKTAENVMTAPQDWSTMRMSKDEQAILARAAHMVRFGDDDESEIGKAIKPEQLLIPKRYEDRKDDLWTTWNVTQESVIRGGLRGMVRGENGRLRRASTRAVNGIDQDIKLNKALWMIGEQMAALKSQAIAA